MLEYLDDCLIFAQNDNIINDLIKALSMNYLPLDQGSVSDYLGIRIMKDNVTTTITMMQP
jgi:hypothetical protein